MPFRTIARVVLTAVAVTAAFAACSHGGSSSSAETAAQPAAMSMVPALPEGVTTAMIATGDSIFHAGSCKNCHGIDAKGGKRGPDLTGTQWVHSSGTYAGIVETITTGVPKEKIKMTGAPFAMRPRGGSNMTDDQIRQVAAYVFTLSHH